MSGHMHWKHDDCWQATCDLCDWFSPVDSHEGAWQAQRDHERTCRPLRPDPIPDVDFPYPPCPICDGDLSHEDDWYCERCEVAWKANGSNGEFVGEVEALEES